MIGQIIHINFHALLIQKKSVEQNRMAMNDYIQNTMSINVVRGGIKQAVIHQIKAKQIWY